MAHSTSPYDLLLSHGISPQSSQGDVRNFDTRGERALRDPWHALKDRRSRLHIDFFLYEIQDQSRLSELQNLVRANQGSDEITSDQVRKTLDSDAPVMLLFFGRRQKALSDLEEDLLDRPHDGTVAHRLALLHYANAIDHEEHSRFNEAIESWQSAISFWVRTLEDDAYWDAWNARRKSVYQITTADRSWQEDQKVVRTKLLDHLPEIFQTRSARFRAQEESSLAQHYFDLQVEYRIEREATDALKNMGGLTLATGQRLACGPIGLAQLNLQELLSNACAQLTTQNEQEQTLNPTAAAKQALHELVLDSFRDKETLRQGMAPEEIMRLRCCFSQLARGFILLKMQRPQEVDAVLPPRNVREDFDASNPAYAKLSPESKSKWFRWDWRQLSIRAEVDISRRHITTAEPDLDAAADAWKKAIVNGGRAKQEKETALAISDLVCGRAEALMTSEDTSGIDSLQTAVQILEKAYSIIGDRDDGAIADSLADGLLHRGVRRHDSDEHGIACEDLARAFDLNPHNITIRRVYCEMLANRADEMPRKDEAIELLERALRLAEAGLREHGASEKLEGTVVQIRGMLYGVQGEGSCTDDAYDELEAALSGAGSPGSAHLDIEPDSNADLIRSAERMRDDGQFQSAVDAMQELLNNNPEPRYQGWATEVLCETLAAWARFLLKIGRPNEAREVVDRAPNQRLEDPRILDVKQRLDTLDQTF